MRSIVLALALSAAACSKPKPVEVTPRSVTVAAIEPQGIQLALVLDVRNPNGFPIKASDVKGTVEIQGGGQLGSGAATGVMTVGAEQTVQLPAQLGVGWTNVTALAPFALSAKPVPYRIVGSARVGSERLNMEVPFDIAGELTREQVAQIALRGASGIIPNLLPAPTP